jgi:hypothetical protein
MAETWRVIGDETRLLDLGFGAAVVQGKVAVVLECPNGHRVTLASEPGQWRAMREIPCHWCPPVDGRDQVWPMPSMPPDK